MGNTISPRGLEVKHAGLAVECGNLTVLLNAIMQQPVMVMALERSFWQGSLIHQWAIHVTTRSSARNPVYYATLRAAEVVQRPMGLILTHPAEVDPQLCVGEVTHCAQRFQQQLQVCVAELLSRSARVSHVVAPARFRLPDEWVWSARCEESRIPYRDGSWILVDEEEQR